MKINAKEAKQYITECMKANLVPMVTGSPGIGKSDIVKQIADKFNLKVVDIRLSQCDPVDLNGFATIDKEKDIARYVPMDIFPVETTKLPEGKDGWIVFFDEINSAANATQIAAYKIVLDKLVNQTPLHKKCKIVCAGNLTTDRAIVNRLSTAMQSRLIHFEMVSDIDSWLKWANTNSIDHRITGYLQYVPTNLMNFDPNHNNETFPSPRTWSFVNKLIKNKADLFDCLPLIAGAIGEPVAREFAIFTKMYNEIPDIKKIKANPSTAEIPSNPGALYAVSSMLSAYIDQDNADNLMIYIERLPLEFTVITMRNALAKNKELMKNKPIMTWVKQCSSDLF